MSTHLLELFHQSGNHTAEGFSIQAGTCHLRFFSDSEELQAWLLPPVSHLLTDSAEAGFDIYCFLNPGDITTWLLANGLNTTLHKTFHGDGFRYCTQEDGLFWFDADKRQGFIWGKSLQALEPYRSKPFSRLFFWLFENQNMLWCHGACIGLEGKGVLIPGIGGAGKSTTVAAALLNGFDFLGDDYLLIQQEERQVFGMYSSLMLSEKSADFLQIFERAGELKPQFIGNKDKWCYHLFPAFKSQLKSSLKLKAILIPELTFEKNSSISETIPEEAMNAFVSSIQTAWLFGGNYANLLRGFYFLAQKTPVFRLSIGKDLTRIPKLFTEFIADFD